MSGYLTRDRLAGLAGLAAPLALATVLVPFRAGFPNTDAALAALPGLAAVVAGWIGLHSRVVVVAVGMTTTVGAAALGRRRS